MNEDQANSFVALFGGKTVHINNEFFDEWVAVSPSEDSRVIVFSLYRFYEFTNEASLEEALQQSPNEDYLLDFELATTSMRSAVE
jgi:Ni,Fe-hydrogenase I large subunit